MKSLPTLAARLRDGKRLAQSLVQGVGTRWKRLQESRLARAYPMTLAARVVREMGNDDATHFAAGVAYYALFSLFPLLLGLMTLGAAVLEGSEGLQGRFVEFITGYIPGSADIVERNIDTVSRFRGGLAAVSVIGLLWSASGVFAAISRAVNRAWDIQQDRPFYISKPRQLGMALGVGALFIVSLVLTSVIRVVGNAQVGIQGWTFSLPTGVVSLALQSLPWLITFVVFVLLYKFLPNTRTHWRFVWVGALAATVLFETAKNLFVWYLKNFANYGEVYGPLASVIVLLLWAYLSALVLIIGAEIAAEHGRLWQERRGKAGAGGG